MNEQPSDEPSPRCGPDSTVLPVPGRAAVGHPVDVATGTYFTAWNDVEVGGHAPLVLRRYYSTGLLDEHSHGFGRGWTCNFMMRLTRDAAGYRLRDQNGGVVDFLQPMAIGGGLRWMNASASMELRLADGAAYIYHWHDWRTTVEVLCFRAHADGRYVLERISPPAGGGLLLEHDALGRLSTVTQAIEHRRLRFTYDGDSRISQLQLECAHMPPRVVATYRYDAADRLVEVMDALGVPIGYGYDRSHRMTTEKTRAGATFHMQYDAEGRCVSTRGADGFQACGLKYLPGARITLVTDSLGAVSTYEFNGSGQVVRETRPDQGTRLTVYDDQGRIVEEVDALARSTRYVYDDMSNTASISHPDGRTARMQYDDDHQPTVVSLSSGTWELAYDQGRLVASRGPSKVATHYGYSQDSALASITPPSGNVIRFLPDAQWTLMRVVDEFGLDREEHYDDLMNVNRIVEPDGTAYVFDFDACGRLRQAMDPTGAVRQFNYDAGGNLADLVDAQGLRTSVTENVHGRIVQVITEAGRRFSSEWDTEARLKRWINPAGDIAEFEHDAAGREVKTKHFDGRVERWRFDVVGRRTACERADGSVLEFKHDLADNLLSVSCGGDVLQEYQYDAAGRLVAARTPDSEAAFVHDLPETIRAEVQNGRRIDYAYAPTGALLARSLEGSPLPPLALEWDARLRLVSLRRERGETQLSMRYDAMDRCVERRLGESSVEQLRYDPLGRLAGQRVHARGRLLVDRNWLHDARGEMVEEQTHDSAVLHHAYDPEHRLGASVHGEDQAAYRYDIAGNLVAKLGRDRTDALRYHAGNCLQAIGDTLYERDPLGRVTAVHGPSGRHGLTWNPLGQLTELSHPDGARTRFAYDALGRRIRREHRGAVTLFYWAGEQLLAEETAGKLTEYFQSGHVPVMAWQQGAPVYFVHAYSAYPSHTVDHWGQLIGTLALDDWGAGSAPAQDAWRSPFRFPGQYADDGVPFVYNRFRYYDPVAGQYLSPDPLGLGAGANEYGYCPNPIAWRDPFGLSCGIPAGQHSVYVLEKGPPPTPPTVIYVGITRQSPHDRLSQHKANPPGGVKPDSMRIIATGPPQVPDRTAARLIESSILNNSIQPGNAGALNNKERPVNTGTYYHSNIPSACPPGTTHMPASATTALLNNPGTTIK